MMPFQGQYFKQQEFIVEELLKGYLKELEEFDCFVALGNLRELKMSRGNSQKRDFSNFNFLYMYNMSDIFNSRGIIK